MAIVSITSETWRCQTSNERVSLWPDPNSFFAVSKLSSIAPRCPSTPTRRIKRPRVHGPKAVIGVDSQHIAFAGTRNLHPRVTIPGFLSVAYLTAALIHQTHLGFDLTFIAF